MANCGTEESFVFPIINRQFSITNLSDSDSFAVDIVHQVTYPAGVTPFIVIPRDHLDTVAIHYPGERRVHDGRALIASKVAGDQLSDFISENTLHRSAGCRLQGSVHLI